MKILLWAVHPLAKSGGGKICALMTYALSENHSVIVNAYDGISLGPTTVQCGNKNVRVIPFLDSFNQTCDILSDCDLVITIGDLWQHHHVYEAVSQKAKPWIAYVGSEGANYPHSVKIDKHKLDLKRMVRLISSFWAFTKHSHSVLRREFPDVPCEVLPHAVDVVSIRNATPFPLRAILRMPENPPLWLFVGFNTVRKGLDLYLRQLVLHREAIGYMHTDAYHKAGIDLFEARRALGLENRLWLKADLEQALKLKEFTENETYGIYKAADLFLHPHRAEGFGLCVLEALTAGVPVLASDCGGPATYLPSRCKIPVSTNTQFRQLGGVGYRMWEPIIPKIRPGKHKPSGFNPAGYDISDFVRNVNSLMERKYQEKIWVDAA